MWSGRRLGKSYITPKFGALNFNQVPNLTFERDSPEAGEPLNSTLGVIRYLYANHTLFCFFLMLSFSVTHAADLQIGAVSLSLGMEQVSVMKELHARYHVVAVAENNNMFFVSESKPPNISVIGGVSFDGGRLTWIQRNWGSFSGKINPVEVTKSMFSAIESARKTSGASAVINTSIQRIPGSEFKSVYFVFPDRKITVSTTDGDAKYGQQVSIEESVSIKP
jgi:hypothetical protein